MGALLAFALIASDPGLDGAAPDTASSEPEPATEGAPAATVSAEQALPSVEAASPERESAPPLPFDAAVRLTVEASVGASPGTSSASFGKLGLGLELGWLPFQFLKLHATISGAWVGVNDVYAGALSNRGELRLLFGASGVLPFTWGELFAGLESGSSYSDATGYDCGGCGYDPEWSWQPVLRLRGGIDFTRLRPFVLGADVAYTLIARSYQEVHWAEVHGRVGVGF